MAQVNCFLSVILLTCFVLPLHSEPDAEPQDRISRPEQQLLTQYLLQRLLGNAQHDLNFSGDDGGITERGDDQEPAPSIIFPQTVQKPIRRLLDQAKANIDVIDFRKPHRDHRGEEKDYIRRTRMPDQNDFEKDHYAASAAQPSEAIPTFLPFPGTEPARPVRPIRGCSDCQNQIHGSPHSRFAMPLTTLGEKKYYLGIFFKANWYKAEQYCRFHGMHLASVNTAPEQKDLEEHIQSYGMGHEHFWTSGTDQAEEGKFFWMSTGKPVTYENWNAGEPNNFQYENGEQEHCLELWNRDGKGMRWNDTPCSFETFFVCEV